MFSNTKAIVAQIVMTKYIVAYHYHCQ